MTDWNFLIPRKPLVLFLLNLMWIYGLLYIPWNGGITDGCIERIQWLGKVLYARDNDQEQITFNYLRDDPSHPFYTRVAIFNRALMNPDGSGPERHLDFDTRGLCWLPEALLFALVWATPVPWVRKFWALLYGLPVLVILSYLSLGFFIWQESSEIGLLTLTPFWKEVVQMVRDMLIGQVPISAPVFIWIFVTFRREDRISAIGHFILGPIRKTGKFASNPS